MIVDGQTDNLQPTTYNYYYESKSIKNNFKDEKYKNNLIEKDLIEYTVKENDTLKKIILKTFDENYNPSWKEIFERIDLLISVNKNIKEIESVLSHHNKRTCHYEKFKNYLIEKNKLNLLLFSHYEKTFFRKFKLNRYINTQKSESKMIKNFTKKFGEPNDVLFIMGDYDKGSNNMSGLEPTICKKFRKILGENIIYKPE